MTPAVSILVPVYNVSDYIERCAHSLFQQTFYDIEYVFVNDCTPDDSIEKLQKIIEQYPNRKPFIKVIYHDKNRGVAAARNTAIDNSSGKYLQHIDSDDWLELDMIETLYNKAETEQADIVVSDILMEKKNGTFYEKEIIDDEKKNHLALIIEDKVIQGYLWSKFIKRELCTANDCRFIEGLNLLEDRHVSVRLFYYAKTIVKIDSAFYHYNKTNINSITNIRTSMHYENVKLFHELLEEFLKEKGLYGKYIDVVKYSSVQQKAMLFTGATDYEVMKKYTGLYRDFEMKYLHQLRRPGEKLVIFFAHFKLDFFAYLISKLIQWKNQKVE